jgi:DNA-binding response OmpR family regulator
MRVLVVEDELRAARNVAQVPSKAGNYPVDICTDGEHGRHLASTNPYDLTARSWCCPRWTAWRF